MLMNVRSLTSCSSRKTGKNDSQRDRAFWTRPRHRLLITGRYDGLIRRSRRICPLPVRKQHPVRNQIVDDGHHGMLVTLRGLKMHNAILIHVKLFQLLELRFLAWPTTTKNHHRR